MTSRHTLTDAAAKRITSAIMTQCESMKFTFRSYHEILKKEGYRLSITRDLLRWYMDRDVIKFSLAMYAIAEVMATEVISARECISQVKYGQFLLNDFDL